MLQKPLQRLKGTRPQGSIPAMRNPDALPNFTTRCRQNCDVSEGMLQNQFRCLFWVWTDGTKTTMLKAFFDAPPALVSAPLYADNIRVASRPPTKFPDRLQTLRLHLKGRGSGCALLGIALRSPKNTSPQTPGRI